MARQWIRGKEIRHIRERFLKFRHAVLLLGLRETAGIV